jgi:hypothetical protein
MAHCGQFIDFGKVSTHKVGKLGQTIWPSYVSSAWVCQHLGGIFSSNGKGVSEKPRSCVPISSTFTSSKNSEQQLDFWNNFWFHFAIR